MYFSMMQIVITIIAINRQIGQQQKSSKVYLKYIVPIFVLQPNKGRKWLSAVQRIIRSVWH